MIVDGRMFVFRSAHPAKRDGVNNKNKRAAARPTVVNIGTDNKKKMVKKTKKPTLNPSVGEMHDKTIPMSGTAVIVKL